MRRSLPRRRTHRQSMEENLEAHTQARLALPVLVALMAVALAEGRLEKATPCPPLVAAVLAALVGALVAAGAAP